MSTYDIVHDIRYGIRYAHTISYITDIRYRMYLQTYDIVYVMDSLCSTISYVVHTTSHVDIRYPKNIRYRTYDIVCPTKQYRIYDIVYTIWYTTSNTGYTISYIWTYNIVGDIQYHMYMWQESGWYKTWCIWQRIYHIVYNLLIQYSYWHLPSHASLSYCIQYRTLYLIIYPYTISVL